MRILIADSKTRVRFALRVALERQADSKTIGEAGDADDLIAQVRAICPDLAIIAWELPGMPIPDLIGLLHGRCGKTRVIILSGRAETRTAALAAGADEFVCMCDSPDELSSAVATCLAAISAGRA